MTSLALKVQVERWPIAGGFTISRGRKTEAEVITVELSDGWARGRGECVPYARYGESIEGVAATLEAMGPALARGLEREALQEAMPAGAARNALDCAFWDLAVKRAGRPAYQLARLEEPKPLVTAFTISLGSPEAMAQAAALAREHALLKVKLGGEGDLERIAAVRDAAPHCELIIDANEAWSPADLSTKLEACARANVTLVEQPLPAADDDILAQFPHPVPVCADESVHDVKSLAPLVGKYDAVNIKLDKAGGLTEALAMADAAEKLGFELMVGCMVATSLSMAPAMLVAQRARVVDLDGALLLAHDRPHGLLYQGSLVHPSTPALWG
ncbi:MAG: N-acetyl-D-Glu racemase DgcA [Xanthobacteraceae bacterium]